MRLEPRVAKSLDVRGILQHDRGKCVCWIVLVELMCMRRTYGYIDCYSEFGKEAWRESGLFKYDVLHPLHEPDTFVDITRGGEVKKNATR